MLLKELVEIGTNLHNIHSYLDVTPFTRLVDTFFFFSGDSLKDLEVARDRMLPTLISSWLECLQEIGVDLEEYGRKEVELHREGLVSWTWDLYRIDVDIKIQSLVYGPLPSDWNLEVDFAERSAVGSPQRKSQRMPGGWIEDDDREQEQDLQASDDD